jgi:hypothetical protein
VNSFYFFERLENAEAEMNAKLNLTCNYKSLFPFLATVGVYSSMFQKCAKKGTKNISQKI